MSLAALTLALLAAAPTPLEPTPAGLPKASRWRLDNGLRVVFIESRGAPWLEVRLGFRIGSASDPIGKEGLASLTAGLLTAGAPGKDEQAIAQELARLGAALDVSVEHDATVLSAQVLTIDPSDARGLMDLVADVALAATLPADALERHRTLSLAGVRNLVDQPGALADMVARAAALAGLAEARPSVGTLSGIAAVAREDVVAWRDRALVPQHAVLVIAGSIDPEGMLTWVVERFGAWGAGVECRRDAHALSGTCSALCDGGGCLDNPTALPRARRATTGAARDRVVLVAMDDPNMEQVEWRYAAPNPVPVMDPRWGAFRLGAHVLGGEFTSRLNRVLRDEHGLTYSAYIAPEFGGWESGVIAIQTDATPAALGQSLALGVELWKGMATEEVPADELEVMRLMLVHGFPFRFETVSHTLEQLTFVELADVPYAYLSGYTKALAGVGPAEVRAAMAAAAAAQDPVLVVAGPPAIEPTLAAFGPVRVVKALDFLTNGP